MYYIVKILIAAIFLVSGVSKILSPKEAETYIKYLFNNSIYLPNEMNIFVYLLGIVEIVLSFMLLYKKLLNISVNILIALIILFSLSILSFPIRGIAILKYGCFGELVPYGSEGLSIVRNILILLLLLSIRFYPKLNNNFDKNSFKRIFNQ